ncbi:acyltransferase family protein [Bradyrhizobium cenepequi]|uniref:acyltransferase family protein n=1 Tax=Bradyrhizobium cenepequi TaxID=2821403 RepID=UPI001CE24203|nr:acyltransferase [Bradyrhizobium cenepequi]MCA6109610.1 acyltransferase [Bradyrhizobium cenepequi]
MDHKNTLRFDVARGVAAIVVLVGHTAQCFAWRLYGAGSWAEMASGWAARFAVLAFFLLSGRLITASIASNIRRNGRFDAIDYFLNRIARLYPPLLFAIMLVVAVVVTVHLFGLPGSNGSPLGTLRASGLWFTPGELAQSLLLYNGLTIVDGPLWTLYIEVKFYIAAGGAAMLAFGRTPISRAIGGVLVAFAVWTGIDHYRFWFLAMIWCLGVFTNLPMARKPGIFLAVSTTAIIVCYMSRGFPNYIDDPLGTLVQSMGCAAIAYALLLRDWAEIDFPAWLVRTGDFSYTLYVIHFPILAFALSMSFAISDASFVVAIVAALTSSALALLIAIRVAPVLENTPRFKAIFSRFV